MVINTALSFKNLDSVYKKFPDVIFVNVDKNTSYKEVIKNILQLLKTDANKKFILVSSLEEYVENKENKNLQNCKKFVKLIGNKGYNINYVRVGDILENNTNIVNKKIEQIKKYKKTYFSNNKKHYYFISCKDVEKGFDKIVTSRVKGHTFNFSLNKINEEKLLIVLEEYFKFKKELVKINKSKAKRSLPNFKSLELINFKPEITVKQYVKQQIPPVELKKSKNFRKISVKQLVKRVKRRYLGWAVITVLTWGILGVMDFSYDNYLLYKSLQAKNTQKAIFYSSKLRQKYLPTKVGDNYKNIYNSIYYGATAVELLNSDKNGEQKQAIIESLAKSVEYAKEIDSNLLISSFEKNYFNNVKPLITELDYNKGYINFLDILFNANENLNLVVLVQNSNELRTSGGFVGSYALVNIENKSIKNIKFDDIYNVDGQLKQTNPQFLVYSPTEIKNFLKTDYLYARDLNILLNDDEKNNAYIKYFENTLNVKVDGIVYINLKTIKNILEYTGPIYLSSYDKTVTKDNFDTLAQTYSEKNYYEGSSQKQNFLRLLGSRVIEETNKKGFNTLGFITTILKSNNTNDLQVFINNPYLKQKFENAGLYKPINNLQNKEFIYLVENNLGENKVNKMTEKSVIYHIGYDIRRSVKITDIEVKLKNNSKDSTFPYGDYKGVLTIVTPSNLFISTTRALYKDKEIDISNTKTITDLNGLAGINLPFAIKPGEETTLLVSYEEQIQNYDKNEHKFIVVKQPGSKDYTLDFNLNIPDKLDKSLKLEVMRDTEFTLK